MEHFKPLANKFGIWVVSALFASNLFFIRGLVDSIEASARAVNQLKNEIGTIQESTKGLLELRIDVAILKNSFDDLKSSVNKSNNRRN